MNSSDVHFSPFGFRSPNKKKKASNILNTA